MQDLFYAYRTFSEDDLGFVIRANSLEEAQEKTLLMYGHWPIDDRERMFRGAAPMFRCRKLESVAGDPNVFDL